jgi:hypothetical protein
MQKGTNHITGEKIDKTSSHKRVDAPQSRVPLDEAKSTLFLLFSTQSP